MGKLERQKNIELSGVQRIIIIILILLVVLSIIQIKNNKYLTYGLSNMDTKIKIKNLIELRDEYEEEIGIIEVDYNFDNNFESNNPKEIIIHHTGDIGLSAERISEIHSENGWNGIGYHYYIRQDGSVYRGREENAVGAHAKGKNKNTLGIALEGNFEESEVTEKQIDSLVKICVDMIIKYDIEDIFTHRDVFNTLCPGQNFHIEEVKQRINKEIIELNKK